MVTVTSAASTAPTVFPLMQCGSGTGDTVTLGCLATGFTPSAVTFAWNKVNGDALTDFIQYPPVQKGNLYSGVSQIRVTRQEWDAKDSFQCAVTHAAVTSGPVIFTKPIVHHKLPTLKVLASSSEEVSEVSFSCFAKDFSPNEFEFTWLKDDKDIPNSKDEAQTLAHPGAKDDNGTTLYSAASFLTLPSSEWNVDNEVTCQFKGKGEDGPIYDNSSLTYQGKEGPICEGCKKADVEVEIEGPIMEDMILSGKGIVKCHINIHKPSVTAIYWENQAGEKIPTAVIEPPKGKTGKVSLPLDITYDEWSKGTTFNCIVENDNWLGRLTTPYAKTIGVPLRPSVFMLPPLEHTRKDTVTLTCYVKDFFPEEVSVTWLIDDEKADSKYEHHTTKPVDNNDGSYSAYGLLSISLDQWKNDDMVYSCVVYHESVANTTKAIARSIGHRTFDRTNLVNLNMNIPETCKAQ